MRRNYLTRPPQARQDALLPDGTSSGPNENEADGCFQRTSHSDLHPRGMPYSNSRALPSSPYDRLLETESP